MQDENHDNEFIQIDHHEFPNDELLQIGQSTPEIEELPASLDGYESFGGYDRHVPDRFTLEKDDRLMNSLIQKYAIEMKVDGRETREFYLNK